MPEDRTGSGGWTEAHAYTVIAVVVLVVAFLLVIVGTALSGLGCDDHCQSGDVSWTQRSEAWQWTALVVLPGASFLAALWALVAASIRRHVRGAQVALVIAVLAAVAWVPFVAEAGG